MGILQQLKNVLNRTNLPTKTKTDPNTCEHFLEVVTVAHIIATCRMKSLDDKLDPSIVPSDLKFRDKRKKAEDLTQVTEKFTARFINLSILKKIPQSGCKRSDCDVDGVLKYAPELRTLSSMTVFVKVMGYDSYTVGSFLFRSLQS